MQLLNDTKRNVSTAMRHYMVMRLKFRGTVFAESRLADTSTNTENCQTSPSNAIPQQAIVKH